MAHRQFVLDASLIPAWCFENESCAMADAILASFENGSAMVPSIWPYEVAEILETAVLQGDLDKSQVRFFLTQVRKLPITVEVETSRQVYGPTLDLALERHLSMYEAAYLDLAIKEGLPLATLSPAVAEVAKALNIPVYSPDHS